MVNIHNSLDKVLNENNVVIKELNDIRQSVMLAAVAVRNMSEVTNEECHCRGRPLSTFQDMACCNATSHS